MFTWTTSCYTGSAFYKRQMWTLFYLKLAADIFPQDWLQRFELHEVGQGLHLVVQVLLLSLLQLAKLVVDQVVVQ